MRSSRRKNDAQKYYIKLGDLSMDMGNQSQDFILPRTVPYR